VAKVECHKDTKTQSNLREIFAPLCLSGKGGMPQKTQSNLREIIEPLCLGGKGEMPQRR
jgi:hypothetical protein